jgi:hypothetical protein
MRRVSIMIAMLVLIGTTAAVSAAQTQPATKSCSVEKCIAVCTKNGGRTCDLYCRNQMQRQGCP